MITKLTRIVLLFAGLSTLSNQVSGQEDVKVLLCGNTADTPSQETLINIVDQYCSAQNSQVVWVLNGDLFPEHYGADLIKGWGNSVTTLLAKYPNLQIVINQGDRDWASGGSGWQRALRLQEMIQQFKHKRLRVFFEDGCPGPWSFSIGEHLEIVVINSEWFNRKFDKPLPSMNLCAADIGIFMEDLRDVFDENSNKNVLLLSHYPVASAGRYGGRFPATYYMLPPIVGAVRVAFHQQIGNTKDLSNENFSEVRPLIQDLLDEYNGVVLASGHERNHSVIVQGNNAHVNSGAVVTGDYVARIPGLASIEPGVVELSYSRAGQVTYRLIELNNTQSASTVLWRSPCDQTGSEKANPAFDPCKLSADKLITQTSEIENYITKPAGPGYEVNGFKRFWLGQHYRSSWTMPVEVPYLDMDSTFEGLSIIGRGGGRQTTSLKLAAANGKEYVYRSVDKDPSKALNYSLRGTLVSEILKDQTTTQQPYGALAASSLLDRTGILHASPKLFVIPSDPKLGSYHSEFDGLMGLMEERPSDKVKKENIFANADHIEKSHKLFAKLYADHDNHVDVHEFAKARVFDILVGDWGKHEDNWKWAGFKTQQGEVFRPIPRDRDHVFSRWDGILPFLADRAWAKPSGENFDYTIKGLRSLMWQARHLDRQLTGSLTRKDWIEAARQIQNAITNHDIETAIHKMPEEIYSSDGKIIEAKLKQRLKDLHLYAGRYYMMLAPQVDVVGSNKKEFFQVDRKADGSVAVDMYDLDAGTGKPRNDRHYYSRTFLPSETKEIRLFGLMDDDVFALNGDATSSILVRIIGGEGADRIIDESHANGKQTRIYERDSLSSVITGSTSKRVMPKVSDLYDYNRTAFAYNTYFPQVLLSYNAFTGLTLQGGVSFTRHNFDKPDFSVRHSIKGSVSSEKNYGLEYENQFRHFLGRWDFISGLTVSRPLNYNYFFGVGNNTENEKALGKNYYRAQYDLIGMHAGLTRTFWKQSLVSFAAHFERTEGVKRDNSYLANNSDVFGSGVVHNFFLESSLDVDFRDATILPERGFRFFVSNLTGHIPQASTGVSTISQFGIEQYLSTYNTNPVTLGIRLGGGATSGELPFYRLLSLGQLNDLRGFKRNRFSGHHKAYLNTELRWQILERKNTLIPLKLGINTFFDVGRIWAKADTSNDQFYHLGYGAGFYIAPFLRQTTLTISAGFSPEEPFLLMFGIGTNAFR